MLKRSLSLLVFSLAIILQINAQQSIFFDHLGIEKGLSNNSVLAITKDANGFMWFGTRFGLNRYDGYKISTYNCVEDTTSIPNNYINCLFSDSKKRLWVGTASGLAIYRPASNNFNRVINQARNATSNSNSYINCLYEDKKGNIWVGTTDGLNRFYKGNTSKADQYLKIKDSPFHNIRTILEDSKGNLWIGTTNGLLIFSLDAKGYQVKTFLSSTLAGSISDNYITSIVEDQEHRLWIGTRNGGLNLYNDVSGKFISFKRNAQASGSLVNNTIRCLTLDKANKLWIGTLDGISLFDVKTYQSENFQFDPENKKSLNQNSVYSIYKDSDDLVWVGTYFGGVNISYPYNTIFNVFNRRKGIPSINSNVISGFAEDQSKNLWIGTEGGGLNYFNRQQHTFKQFKNIPNDSSSLSSNLVKKVFIDKNERLWIGTHGGGLNLYQSATGTFKRFLFGPKTEELPDEIIAIAEDSKSQLWIATQQNGIKLSNPAKDRFTDFKMPANYPKNGNAKSLFIDKDQNVYIGTTVGLYIYNPLKKTFDQLKNVKTGAPLIYYINCILETTKGQIYLGTYYNGLVFYDPKNHKILKYTQKDGLPHDNVLGIKEDERGNLWVSTANGLSMFDPSAKTFKNYTVADGLPGNEFNLNAAYKGSNGEMLFGGYNGFISFYPKNIQMNTKPSKISLTEVNVSGKPVSIQADSGSLNSKSKIVLSYDHSTLNIGFALLNFIKPEKNKYAYKLDGFEKDWNYVNIPQASYTTLPPGSYTFVVKGINNDGVYSQNTATLLIVVKPPFYKTWWAYLSYAIIIAAVLFIFIRYLLIRTVLKKEIEVNNHKLEFFTNISHEIRTPLTLIVGPLEKIIENSADNPELNGELRPIKNNADRLMNLINELLDFRKAESGKMLLKVSTGNIVKFCHEIFLAFKNVALANHIEYTFESPNEEINIYFDKVQLEKVLYNLLSNAIKFTPRNGAISLRITENNDLAEISISDNGKGIPLEEQDKLFGSFYQASTSTNIGTGLGLSLAKSITELHKGQIKFSSKPQTESKPGNTIFTVSLRKGKAHFDPSEFVSDYLYYDDAKNYTAETINTVPESLSPAPSANKDYSILVVEDNAEVRKFITQALANTYNIYEADNGMQGLEMALELIPDLILSDVMMPVMDGLELCRRIKTDQRTSHIPVVLLTARSAYIHQINGLENGADAYIMKPFNLKILQLNIQNQLIAKETMRVKFAQTVNLEPRNMPINTTEHVFLNKIIQIIEDNLSDTEFDVPTLASEIGMSQPVLYKKIRALTDLTVKDFIKSLRFKKALQLMELNPENISEIAYSVGFRNRKYFSIEFRKQFGKSPSEYIQELKKDI